MVPPAKMEFLPSRVEAVVNSNLLLPLMVQGYTTGGKPVLLPFSDCRQLEFKIAMSDTAIFNITTLKNIGKHLVG